jgi:hypothetical protein
MRVMPDKAAGLYDSEFGLLYLFNFDDTPAEMPRQLRLPVSFGCCIVRRYFSRN